jgi:hypothetical protein
MKKYTLLDPVLARHRKIKTIYVDEAEEIYTVASPAYDIFISTDSICKGLSANDQFLVKVDWPLLTDQTMF